MPRTVENPLLLTLAVAMALALAGLGFVTVAPNRILSGQSLPLWQVVSSPAVVVVVVALIALLAGTALLRPVPVASTASALTASLLLVAALVLAGSIAREVAASRGAAVRTSLGGAFWVVTVASALAAADAVKRLSPKPLVHAGLAAAAVLALVALAMGGVFDDLALAHEFANRKPVFRAELLHHIGLVIAALVPALVIGTCLGAFALMRPRFAGSLFAVLNLIQTIPSIALFALLIGPLTSLSVAIPILRSLGLAGIGTAPAVIALSLYALLPVARSVHTGFSNVPGDVVDAARGMGMTRLQISRQVAFPLALPVLLAGLRIVVIQLVGLAVVAALIGAGGLGTFIFQGLGQTAADLILLGALSTIGLALLCDLLMKLLIAALTGRRAA
ncbi:ABC transporter permease [Chelatococcus sp. GCM10030263]|uniref:ABC transporter permease n=1 Tax=Chelatococcus sp. GCM10030263 TaxID=3273387 RepID=UPI0036204A41